MLIDFPDLFESGHLWLRGPRVRVVHERKQKFFAKISDKPLNFRIPVEPSKIRFKLRADGPIGEVGSRSYFTITDILVGSDIFVSSGSITGATNLVPFDLCIQGCVLDAQEPGSA